MSFEDLIKLKEAQKLIEQDEITAWKAVNGLVEDEDENYYHG